MIAAASSASAAIVATTVIRFVLAAVFLVAAAAKARDLPATREAVVGLGIPPALGRAASVAVILAEAAVAIGLVVNATAAAAAIVATALLVVFSGLVAVSLAAGRRPPCNCFGSSSSTPIGVGTLVRNAALVALSVAIVVRSGVSGRAALGGVDALSPGQGAAVLAVSAAVVAFGVHSWFLAQLVRQNGRLLERIEQLESVLAHPAPSMEGAHRSHRPADVAGRRQATRRVAIGSMAPRFGGRDVDGRPISIDDLLGDGRPVVLVFLETGCAACVELAADVNARQTAATDRMLVAVVSGERHDVASRFSGPGFDAVVVDDGGEVAERYDVRGTPTALLVLPDGRVASSHAEGRVAADRLVLGSISDQERPAPLSVDQGPSATTEVIHQ